MPLKVEKDGFCELACVDLVVVAKLTASHGGLIYVKSLGAVIGPRPEDFSSVGEEVVQGR